ncbi:unnamed protein product [Closterium sp. NIES-53]
MAAAKRVLRYLCSTSGMGLVLGGRSPVVLTGHEDASWVDDLATQRSSQGYTFSLGSGSVLWRSTRSSSVLSSSCEAEIYTGAMVAQELRWLTYLLTDVGEPPHSPPIQYVDNMLALCREHRLEHRTKHIALCYFLARELQQRGQLHLVYVASEANTADIFTKALQPCDHQRFCTMLACFALLCLTGLAMPALNSEGGVVRGLVIVGSEGTQMAREVEHHRRLILLKHDLRGDDFEVGIIRGGDEDAGEVSEIGVLIRVESAVEIREVSEPVAAIGLSGIEEKIADVVRRLVQGDVTNGEGGSTRGFGSC